MLETIFAVQLVGSFLVLGMLFFIDTYRSSDKSLKLIPVRQSFNPKIVVDNTKS